VRILAGPSIDVSAHEAESIPDAASDRPSSARARCGHGERDVTSKDHGSRQSVAMMLYSDPTNDGRVQREAATLAQAGYHVRVFALGMGEEPLIERMAGVEVIGMRPSASKVLPGTQSPFHPGDPGTSRSVRGGRLGWAAGYGANLRAWGKWAVRAAGKPTIWHAHDFSGLLGLAMGGPLPDTPIVYDSHELYLEMGSAVRMPRPARLVLRRIERRLARRAAGVITINRGVAGELRRRYGVDPTVLMNCPSYVEVSRPGRLRAALGLADQQIVLYHGAVTSGRGIEIMIEALSYLPPSVVFVVLGNGSLVPFLLDQQRRPELSDRIYWHAAVSQEELLSWVVDADLGSVLTEPTELNQVLSTPNKLFECLTAGVPMVASDFGEIRRIVLGEGVGAVCNPTNPRLIAEAIVGLLAHQDELASMRERAHTAARLRYNWDAQAVTLLDLYRRISPNVDGPQPLLGDH
jgi:glycosyltransferase involved in cell wall biosynthesis